MVLGTPSRMPCKIMTETSHQFLECCKEKSIRLNRRKWSWEWNNWSATLFVMGQKEWKKGVVVERLDERSYEVETADGSSYRWNRAHLKRTNGLSPEVTTSESPQAPGFRYDILHQNWSNIENCVYPNAMWEAWKQCFCNVLISMPHYELN